MPETTVKMDGHILDSLLLPKVLDIIVAAGAEYEIQEIHIGRTRHDSSRAQIRISTPDAAKLHAIVAEVKEHGASDSNL